MTDLVLTALSLTAGGRTLVSDLSLRLPPGERLALLGPNGSGKSTLLRVLAGLQPAAAGRVERPAGPPGMLFQDGALWPNLSVAAHLEFVSPRGDRAWHGQLLERLGLAALRDRRPDTLSGGERVRLGLARAFAPRPSWLLLDEPLAHLDARVQDLLRETLPELLDEIGAAAVLVTHEPDTVRLTAQRVLCLSGEGPAWLGSTSAALDRPPTALLAALSGRGTLLEGTADAAGRATLPFGLALPGCTPGARVAAFLDAEGVRFAHNGSASLRGTLIAPDGRGGSWVRVGEHLLRCGEPPGTRASGAEVGLDLAAPPRALEGTR
jgi:ABC-type sulfate/molybdate transport systems ATPase subunit